VSPAERVVYLEQATESGEALAVYRKFLRGENTVERGRTSGRAASYSGQVANR
jgi:hypothetical protein